MGITPDKIKDMVFTEDNFDQKMSTEVKNWLDSTVIQGDFKAVDGAKIHYHYAANPEEKAAVVISHGFCEFVNKYHEVMYYFYEMGYSVFFIEHRGHGNSERFVSETDKVTVRSFDEYVQDLKKFMDEVVSKKSITGKYYLYAHSMGGAIGTLFLEEYPEYFKKAVLTAPMLEIDYGGIPMPLVKLMLGISKIFHFQNRFAPGQHGFTEEYDFEGSCSLLKKRYDYALNSRKENAAYRTYGGTYAWANAAMKAISKLQANADKVKIPVLIFQAGLDTMVCPNGHYRFAAKAGNAKVIVYKNSKHEIFNSYREDAVRYFEEIEKFYDAV